MRRTSHLYNGNPYTGKMTSLYWICPQDFFTGTQAIVRLSQYQWSNPKEYGQMDHINLLTTETRTTRTPSFWGYPPPPHDYPYHWVILDPKSKEDEVKVANLKNSPKFQIFEFRNGHYTRHTFWSCLIRCANMKWIRWVLLKIQSGHYSVHRRTDGQGDTSIPPFQLRWIGGINITTTKQSTAK